jgi:hypothetical protein
MSIETCIEQCQQCRIRCTEAAGHAIAMGADSAFIASLLDCAKVAQATAGFLQRLPDLRGMTGRVCADICQKCVEACAPFPDDAKFVDCAEAAQSCAEACRALAAIGATEEEDVDGEMDDLEFIPLAPPEMAPVEQHG